MKVIKTIKELRLEIKKEKELKKSIGLVPTMGALHNAHLSLVKEAKKMTDFVVMSIFVNPIQFSFDEDLDEYPRPIEKDIDLASRNGVDILFNPETIELFNNGLTFVEVTRLDKNLCGISRPNHFKGVATIVSKLFNIVTPDKAFLGKKDIQQLIIIKKMVSDLNFDIDIVGVDILRDASGLAMSSRNTYLTNSEYEDAFILNQSLKKGGNLIMNGERDTKKILSILTADIEKVKSAKIDYIKIVSPDMVDVDNISDGDILAMSVFIGKTRLIDNYIIGDKLWY